MTARARITGRPLVAVMAVLSGWVAIRATTWEPPFTLPEPDGLFAQTSTVEPFFDAATIERFSQAARSAGKAPARAEKIAMPRAPFAHFAPIGWGGASAPAIALVRPAAFGQLERSRRSSSHQLLYAAAFSYLPPFDSLAGYTAANGTASKPGRRKDILALGWQLPGQAAVPAGRSGAQDSAAASARARWSADAWLFARGGGSGRARLAGINPATYGDNQVGAVVRYALAPRSSLQPMVYGRAGKALVSGGEAEVAGGVSIGLSGRLPFRVHGEVRVTDRPGATEVRPAAFVVTGLPRREIAPGVEADSYLQAGYVGGNFETAFADGKATIEASVVRADSARLSLGGGVWGGAQRDAVRLDIGPTASVVLSTGDAAFRASADYRIRVAGDANPGDGPAATIAASF